MIKAKNYILEINQYKPGKSKIEQKDQIIKLSSNENALGSSLNSIVAYQKHSNEIFRYADGNCNELRNALADKYNIDADRVVCGAGSDEIIAFLTQAFCDIGDEVLYSEYGFLMYSISAKRVGAVGVVTKEVNLTANVDNILEKISHKTRLIFLANPNNPTGSYLNQSEIERLITNTPPNVLIVLDLAYAEFVNKADYPDTISLVDKYENVVMLRTFSKIYGLASLRLGWSYSSLYVAEVLNKTRGPFNVSGAAQSAGVAAIRDDSFIVESQLYNQKWLEILSSEFSRIGIHHHKSVANFILLEFDSIEKCQNINQMLLDNGIILREMSAYNLSNCLRMTIGKDEENFKVIKLLEKI